MGNIEQKNNVYLINLIQLICWLCWQNSTYINANSPIKFSLLFAVHEVPQASTGFSPFSLLYAQKPQGMLKFIKENKTMIPCPVKMKFSTFWTCKQNYTQWITYRRNLLQVQERQHRLCNMRRQFAPGDKVITLLPIFSSKLIKCQGPFEVIWQVLPEVYGTMRLCAQTG